LGNIVTRERKLFAVGAILMIGLALAWPFRKMGVDLEYAPPVTVPSAEPLRASNGDPIATLRVEKSQLEVPTSPPQIAAQMASARPQENNSSAPKILGSFDIANHPALIQAASTPIANPPAPLSETPPPATPPAYNTGSKTTNVSLEEWPAELVHVVANGDTLEKLAERYLNDAGRALEIFDLNRDQLSNPHLLPIGVELRIPRNPNRIAD
jgi:nucleoid-associated protein YgaU